MNGILTIGHSSVVTRVAEDVLRTNNRMIVIFLFYALLEIVSTRGADLPELYISTAS
jgi:hypothetical protein